MELKTLEGHVELFITDALINRAEQGMSTDDLIKHTTESIMEVVVKHTTESITEALVKHGEQVALQLSVQSEKKSEVDVLVRHAEQAIADAYANKSRLSGTALTIHGQLGTKTRHLYNNMCNLPESTYLEVGTYKGASFVSAMYGNDRTKGFCVDIWCEYGGKRECYFNVFGHLPENSVHVIDKDCWQVTSDDIKGNKLDVFMFDGPHSLEDQKKAITYYHQFFKKYVIILIDDWVIDVPRCQAKKGTLLGLEEMKLKVHFSKEIGLVNTTELHKGNDTFWNGIGIFVCERTDI